MEILNIISIAAVVIAPIASVCVGHYLQRRAQKRQDKLEIFKTLMMSRSNWNVESVRALNVLDIVFSDDPAVRNAWKAYYERLCIDSPSPPELKKIQEAQYTLLEIMAVSLGYKDKITWKTIQNPYVPKGMIDAEQNQRKYQEGQLALANIAMKMNKMQFTNAGVIPETMKSAPSDSTEKI